jgi:threonylcarbamoyladenosine tRNA methylthiotransferase MtaB
MKRVAFATLGCKVNRSDTHRLQEALGPEVRVVPFSQRADLYVINTCTVTGVADRESRQLVHRARRRNPAAPIVVTGCLADRDARQVTLPGVVAVVPNGDKGSLPRRLTGLLADPAEAPASETGPIPAEGPVPGSSGASPAGYVYRPAEVTRPPLKIQDGCAGGCTYCAVAAARGQPRSLPPDQVLRALERYGRQGCPEVVLAGIDLGSYGLDLEPPTELATLLESYLRERPVPRLRLSSLEVLRLDDRLLETLAAAGEAVCHHLHLPLQSGAAAVLARMGRPYDPATYAERIRAVRRWLPGAAIGADVIAGFPGERPEDHRQTRRLLVKLQLAYLHVFPYSPRPGTPAASFPDALPGPVIRERAAELRRLSAECFRAYRQSRVGRQTRAVVYEKRHQGQPMAHADEGFPVHLAEAPGALRAGQLVTVRLEGLQGAGMEGRLVLR